MSLGRHLVLRSDYRWQRYVYFNWINAISIAMCAHFVSIENDVMGEEKVGHRQRSHDRELWIEHKAPFIAYPEPILISGSHVSHMNSYGFY